MANLKLTAKVTDARFNLTAGKTYNMTYSVKDGVTLIEGEYFVHVNNDTKRSVNVRLSRFKESEEVIERFKGK